MDEEYQRMAANAIAHEAFCAGQAWQQAAAAHERPCVLWKPRLFIDGNQWCALFGENIQEGVVGFGDSPDAAMLEFDDTWRKKLTSTPGAHPAPSLASDDVSLISEGKTQPAQSVKDAIIDDLQSQFDTEGITEHDSGDALIRLSDAIAAVEDNFVQSAQSVPDGWKLVPIEPTQEMINRVIDERLDALAAGKDHTFIDIYKAMLAAAPKPEAKP